MKEVSILAVLLGVLLSFPWPGRGAVMPTNAVVGGLTIEEWTVEWWSWAYATPTNQNPLLDLDGSRAQSGQPGGPVFFVGSVSGLQPPPVTRTFAVPQGKYLFFPLLPIHSENVDRPIPFTVEQLRDELAGILTNVTALHCRIDGVAVSNLFAHRAISPVFTQNFTNADNLKTFQYGHVVTGLIDPVVSDGYWVMLEPLPVGQHVLEFGGAWSGYFDIAITANITILPNFNSIERQSGGQMRLRFNGLVGQSYVFQASGNLMDWTPFSTNTVTSVPFELMDARATNLNQCFYRAVQQP
jgi:hypothetical protein